MKNQWLWLGAAALGAWWLFGRSSGAQTTSGARIDPSRPPSASQRTEIIKAMQRVLRELGLYPGAIDGIAGSNTYAAAQAYVAERPALRARLAAISDPTQREFATVEAIVNRSST